MIGKWLLTLHIRLLALYQLPLAALVSLDTLRDALTTLGYPAVALFIMIESAGIPFPGETMLLLASFYAAVDHRLQIPIVIACAASGAIIGDNIGYLVGRTGGYALTQRFGRYVFLKPHHLQKARQFFARHGNKTVFVGRFVAVLRAWAAFLAGVNHMPWPIFLIYNAAGGIAWAIIYGCLGFYAGRIFHDNFGAVEHLAKTISWTGAILIVAVVLVAYILFRLRHKRHHEQQTAAEEQSGTTEIVPVEAEQQNGASLRDEAEQELTAPAGEQQIPPLASTPITPTQPEQESASGEQQETLSSPEAK